jgi:hypothetical protein
MPPPETPEQEQTLPTFSEQVASQLGGVRGMLESSIPVLAFVLVNIIWSLTPALVVAVGLALALAGYRLARREPVRHALNGLFGIGIGALLAWKTGSPQDFYLPGIIYTLCYGIAMVASVFARRPLVAGCGLSWPTRDSSVGVTTKACAASSARLTVVWAATFFAKVLVNFWVYFADGLTDDQKASILGIMRIALGFPPYALLLALTVWAVRRYLRTQEQAPPLPA